MENTVASSMGAGGTGMNVAFTALVVSFGWL